MGPGRKPRTPVFSERGSNYAAQSTTYFAIPISAYPEYNGGAIVTEFAAQMISPDNNSRECYKGRDLDCIVAGLSPGRPYLFQVRAFNRAGVSTYM